MLKHIIKVVCIGAVLSTSSALFAKVPVEYVMELKASMVVALPVNEPTIFKNPFMWPASGQCQVSMDEPSADIFVRALNKHGSVNGTDLYAGDEPDKIHTMFMTVHPNDIFYLTADPGARVELTNLGKHPIMASCTSNH